MTSKRLKFTAAALRAIISSYTREAGVRNLEREIAGVCRGVARKFAERRRKPVSIKVSDLHEYLGAVKFYSEVAERTRVAGVATGLAWTPTGGCIIFVEATKMRGKGAGLTLTGQLGDVMKESAQTALSYIRSRAEELDIDDEIFQTTDVHIHVPAGAIPKDGPSAGVTIATAIASVVTGRPVKKDVAMTGEITLAGHVLPIGGLSEKVLAAARAGIRTVILPKQNEPQLEEIPAKQKRGLKFRFVETVDDVWSAALFKRRNGEQPLKREK